MEKKFSLNDFNKVSSEMVSKNIRPVKSQEEAQGEVFPPLETCFPKGFIVDEKEFDVPGLIYWKLRLTESSCYLRNLSCPQCGGSDVKTRGTQTRTVKDIPYLGREVLWDLILPEFRCFCCGRTSFVADIPEIARRGSGITTRLEEFIVFLAVRTSCEGASRILESMDTEVSGDTVRRIVCSYEKNKESDVWRRANQFSGKPVRGITEEQALDIANNLAYYMEPEILSLDREKRLREMTHLFDLVFTQKRVSPGCLSERKGRRKGLPVFMWKSDEI